jgi:hypothetical protein
LREAALKPTIVQRFYAKYDGSPLPPKTIAQNVLATFDVPGDRTSAVYDLLIENARFVGFLKKIKDKDYIDTGSSTGPAGVGDPIDNEEESGSRGSEAEAEAESEAP